MPDENTPGQTPPVVPPAADPPVTPPATPPPDEEKFDKAYVQQLRQEAAANRKKAADLEAKFKADEDAKLGEVDRSKKAADEATKRAEAAEARLKASRITISVERTATKLNLDPELASELVKDSMLEFDEDGKPTNTEKVLQDLIKKWPNLVKATTQAPNINGSDGRGEPPPADPKAREAELKQRFRI